MAEIDAMTAPMRRLVYEYGYVIVTSMRDEGYNAHTLKPVLRDWRERRQRQWLETDYVMSRKSIESIVRAAEMRSAGSGGT